MSLLDVDLENLTTGSGYKFSATKIQDLGASEYTLVTIAVDVSASVSGFGQELENCLKAVFNSCNKSPRRDNLLIRVIQFNHAISEIHGFKLLDSIAEKDYDNALAIGGSTALFDACNDALESTDIYAKQLTAQDYLCNGILFVITDGENNRGNIMNADTIKNSIERIRKSENLESILSILVGVTGDDNSLNHYLQSVKDDGGFGQYISIGNATANKLAKLAEFVSQSISSTSSALGTGAPSQPLNPSNFKF